MKTWIKIALCISLSLMSVLSCIGYASLSENIEISGTAEVEIPSGLFIISVEEDTETRIDSNTVSHVDYTTTVKSALSRTNERNKTGIATYKIVVFNNTSLTYSYRGIYYQTNLTGYNGNNSITTTTGSNKIRVTTSLDDESADAKKVLPGEKLEFTATYTLGSQMSASTLWSTMINFQFGINVDGEREALAVIEEKFLNILNTYTTYEQLIDALDNKFDGRQEWTSNYIGNVVGSTSQDSVAVNTLFAGQLQITVGREQMDATVLIKHENLDWNNYTGDDYTAIHPTNGGVFKGYGCEMTLYLTIDPLNKAGTYVPVYAVVFTCDRDQDGNKVSDWYRIGSTYAGTANVVTYDGNNGTGSFVTDNWRADAASYKVIDGYSFNIDGEQYILSSYTHNVARNADIESIITSNDRAAINTFKTLLRDAKRIIDNQKYAGVGIEIVKEAYEDCSKLYYVNENGEYVVDQNTSIAQLSPAIEKLYNAVNDALIKMDALS